MPRRWMLASTIAGETLFTDAFDLLDIKGTASLKKKERANLGLKYNAISSRFLGTSVNFNVFVLSLKYFRNLAKFVELY